MPKAHRVVAGLAATALAAAMSDARPQEAQGVSVAGPLLASVREAFVHAMDVMLMVCGGVAVLGVALALAFLPRRPAVAPARERGESPQEVTV